MRIGIGLYQGFGDLFSLLSISEGISSQLYIYTFIQPPPILSVRSKQYFIFKKLNKSNLISASFGFIKQLKTDKIDLYIISDFSCSKLTKSKLLQLLVCKSLGIRVMGSSNDQLSCFYDLKLEDIRHVELIKKDYTWLSQIIKIDDYDQSLTKFKSNFIPILTPHKYIFHVGASTTNKKFSKKQVVEFVSQFDVYDILLIGLESDFSELDELVKLGYHLRETNFIDLVSIIAGAKCLICFDSLAANIANAFNINCKIISGPVISEFYFNERENLNIYRSTSDCIKCGSPMCKRGDYKCMREHDLIELYFKIKDD
jgi:ADP-heptose:LPS heptosyltransferase